MKFVGNARPDVAYDYPITRENKNLNGLEVSQCYFIGEKNSARLQSGFCTYGSGIQVDHCIFYNCRCGMVLIRGTKNLFITNSIIYGAYKPAIWFGASVAPFIFRDNIVSDCNFFWGRPEGTIVLYRFRNSIITENTNYMGYITNCHLVPSLKDTFKEAGIIKTGQIKLMDIKADSFQPHDHLNLAPGSDERDIPAEIFKKKR